MADTTAVHPPAETFESQPEVRQTTDSVVPEVKRQENTSEATKQSSSPLSFDDDPTLYIKTHTEALIYWENPKKSALYLGSILGLLILTHYYSVLQISAGLFTTLTGLNLLYVNVYQQAQKMLSGRADTLTNPHSGRLEQRQNFFPRQRVLYVTGLLVDVAESIAQEVKKLVLIQDTWCSAVSVAVSFVVWTLAKYVSTKYLLSFFVVLAFSAPRLYHQHQEAIDKQVAVYSQQARDLAQQYSGIASTKAKELVNQAMTAMKNSSKTQKAE